MADGIGLYVGARSLDLVQVGGTFRAPHLITAEHLDLDQPLTDNPEAIAALVEPLQRLLRQAHLAAPDAQIGISADTAIIRYFQMPTVPPQDRVSAARFEAKKYHPFKLQELNADAHLVILPNDPSVMRVMFYAAKKEMIAAYVRTLQLAGVTPHSIETNLSSLMRAVRRTHQLPARHTAVLISVDHDAANIAIVQQDLVYLARNVTVLPGAAENAPSDIYSALLNDAVVSVDYYRRRFPNEPPVTKVFINGESAPDAWLHELSTALELPVEPLDVSRMLTNGRRLVGNAAVALGLALRGLERGRHAVNLLPQELQPKPRDAMRTLAVESAVAAVVLVLVYQLSAQPVRRIALQAAALQQPRAAGGLATNLTPDQLQHRQRELTAEAALVRDAVAPGTTVAAVLGTLASRIPDAIWLQRLAYQGVTAPGGARTLALDGSVYHPNTATAFETINRYAEALNRDAALRQLFGTLSLTTVQRSTAQANDVTDFHMASEPRGPAGSR